ncbi:PDR/VanB family oxidoreductase [Arthrobacter sp. zg-Y1219]|uniref:PDR/VanB family oxidoreductase n=1 Tax=Arthrobacter sp. zg-Y1219 TaxID=3049067 RepID=UPI0024C46CAD|nr:PDR/VanB family oxidoreductase [Arthrobacter sp. zg-Y1219]MDK1361688.1 PDR/VanB family oxidoreductase [Arthrobacter sp. zg-Y1219]
MTTEAMEKQTSQVDVMELRVRHVKWEAEGVHSLTFVHPEGADLPEWEPGAHLEIVLPSGLVRQYSLCGDPYDRCRYKVAVLREPNGRGGSAEIHDTVMTGRLLKVRGPRNRFELGYAGKYVLIAGGIGITPILSMARELGDRKAWHLYYGGRSLESMALKDELSVLGAEHVTLVPQDTRGILDLEAIFADVDDDTAVYCCGPEGLLGAVLAQAEAAGRSAQVHFERFGAAPNAPEPEVSESVESFEVELRRTGCTVSVSPDQTVLEAIRAVVPDMPSSCEEGFCGTCETRVLLGQVEHRDQILSAAEREANESMFVCVSRAKSPRIVLDL